MARKPNPERQAAIRSGAKLYKSSTPCPKGHIGMRLTTSKFCYTCYREQRCSPDGAPKRRVDADEAVRLMQIHKSYLKVGEIMGFHRSAIERSVKKAMQWPADFPSVGTPEAITINAVRRVLKDGARMSTEELVEAIKAQGTPMTYRTLSFYIKRWREKYGCRILRVALYERAGRNQRRIWALGPAPDAVQALTKDGLRARIRSQKKKQAKAANTYIWNWLIAA